ncbi:dTDP-4-dehydrorhamnose 3,5-epimerase family protein [Candidatus Woesearchaeota archaeon]|nr:dTDP-4-dehydrorhamnose 3,5-epimerase family protein [Candidatus Woesearchaeota archaeon]
MKEKGIVGVNVKNLRLIKDERGFLMEMLRCDDPLFKKFGQVYVSACNPGFVKGWHYHKKQTDNFIVVAGKGRILLYDQREDSATKGNSMEFIMSRDNPILLTIPPGVLHGFEALGKEVLMVVNIPTELYNYKEPDEFRVDPFKNDIPIKWKAKKGG